VTEAIERRATRAILASRLLTRAGDQAWDFALPITLAVLLPQRLRLVVLLFLASKAATVFLMPRLAATVDRWQRLRTARLGVSMQVMGVLTATAGMVGLVVATRFETLSGHGSAFAPGVIGIVLGAIAASLGAGLMDIAVGNDWIPDLVAAERLARVNGRLRQIDLAVLTCLERQGREERSNKLGEFGENLLRRCWEARICRYLKGDQTRLPMPDLRQVF
jgi:hypothetical protein